VVDPDDAIVYALYPTEAGSQVCLAGIWWAVAVWWWVTLVAVWRWVVAVWRWVTVVAVCWWVVAVWRCAVLSVIVGG